MSWKIHLLRYNNYYNRQLKKYNGLDEYLQHEIAPLDYSINFNIKDGITNEIVINGWESEAPDYCIIVNESNNTFTRWFVITTQFITNGQYRLTLKRDVLAEYSTNVLNSPCYVEKGYLENSNPLILNSEKLNVNEIKQNEIQIYDKSGVPWVAIFFNGNLGKKTVTFNYDVPIYTFGKTTTNDKADALKNISSQLYEFLNKNICFDTINIRIPKVYKIDYNTFNDYYTIYNGKYIQLSYIDEGTSKTVFEQYKINFQKFFDYQGREYWRMYLLKVYGSLEDCTFTIRDLFYNNKILLLPFSDMIFDTNFVSALAKNIQLSAGAEVIADAQLLPYNPLFRYIGINRYQNTMSFYSFSNYNNSTYFGAVDFGFDAKIAPSSESTYFPIYGSGRYMQSALENISFVRPTVELNTQDSYKEMKCLYKYRLCSPNYNGSFDFNYADMLYNQNEETIYNTEMYFNIDLSYRPYSSYIHVSPAYSGLYGKDFNDARGLICNGDFSLEQGSDSWAEYKLKNKTYQEQFDRQIQNLEVNNAWNTAEAAVGVATSTATGALTGAQLGSGATVLGGLAGLAGSITDLSKTIALQEETLNYTKDMYNYSLQNIQSIPTSITKVSSINNNNKSVPFIEIYSCTEKEKEAFRNKIKYNGMTVEVIGKLKDYCGSEETYVKGKIIRVENFNDDYHMLTEIGNEVNKGFFIKYSEVESEE